MASSTGDKLVNLDGLKAVYDNIGDSVATKLAKDFSSLSSIDHGLENDYLFAVQRSDKSIASKITYSALETDILSKIGSNGVVSVGHGGTGATTAAAARTNLDVYSKSETNSAIAQNTTTIHNYSGSNNLLIFRVGRLAQIVAYGTKETTSGTGGDVIGTITEPAFRPVSRVFQESTVYDGHSYVECVVEVNLNGNICIRRSDNAVVAGYQPQYLRLVGLTYICNGT